MSNTHPYDDDDIEEKAEHYYRIFNENPTDINTAWSAIPLLKSAHYYQELGTLLDTAHKNFPDHFHIQMEWAKFPGFHADLEETSRRMKLCSAHFPPEHGDGLLFLTEQFLLLRDLEKWDELGALITQHWSLFRDTNIWVAMPALIFTLGACGMSAQIVELIDSFSKKKDISQDIICGITLANAQTIALSALENTVWRSALPRKIDIISIGQNCLPSTIAARWGMIDNPLDFLPFDQSAFPGSSIAEAFQSDFSIFDDETSFIARPFGRHSRIAYHKSTGVHFAHNPLPLTNYGGPLSQTIQRFQQRIQTFKKRALGPDVLFFANICGDCDAQALVDSLRARYGEHVHALLLNTTPTVLTFDKPENITYLHYPYPQDYGWNTVDDYTSARGIAFESHVIAALKRKFHSMQAK